MGRWDGLRTTQSTTCRTRLYQSSTCTTGRLQVDTAAGAPVDTRLPGQEALVDEVAPQRGVVGVEDVQQGVDLALGVPHADVEDLRDVVQDDQSLRVRRRDGRQPAVTQEL